MSDPERFTAYTDKYYASAFAHDVKDTADTVQLFYDRVNAWFSKHGIKTAEGRVTVTPTEDSDLVCFLLKAERLEGPDDLAEYVLW